VTRRFCQIAGVLCLGLLAASAPDKAVEPPVPAGRSTHPAGGYWLGAELFGTPAARRAAAESLAAGVRAEHPKGASPPGITVGRVDDLEETVSWLSRFVFPRAISPAQDERTIHEAEAPVPGGELLSAHGVHLVSLIVSGATADLGLRKIRWPSGPGEILPGSPTWTPAALLPDRAPLFAMPAATMPPASERYAIIQRAGDLYVLGTVDRCTGEQPVQTCLRWLQVVARDGNRFRGGYLPAFWVARLSKWLPAPTSIPRAQLIESGVFRGRAQWLLVARLDDGILHRATVEAPLLGNRFPDASLHVSGSTAVVTMDGEPEQHIALTAAMDRRPD